MSYRGYLIKKTLLGEVFVEKDKSLICSAKDEAEARQRIDELVAQ